MRIIAMVEIPVSKYGIVPSNDRTKSYYQEWKNLEREAQPGDTIVFDREGFYPWKQHIPENSTSRNHVAARITKPLTVTCVPGAIIWNTEGGTSFAVQPPRCSDDNDNLECFQYGAAHLYPDEVSLWEWAEANKKGTCEVRDNKVIPDDDCTLPEPPFLIYSTGYPGDDPRCYRDGREGDNYTQFTPLYWEEIINPNDLPCIPRLPTRYSYTTGMFPIVYGVCFQDCTFTGEALYHIRANYTRNLVIRRCRGASDVRTFTPNGIWVYYSIGALVEHCCFIGGRHGLALTGSINTIYRYNVLGGQIKNGIWLDEASHGTILEQNIISGTKWAGIAADEPTRLIIRNNHLEQCGDPERAENLEQIKPGVFDEVRRVIEGQAGINIQDPIKVNIHDNRIIPNRRAINSNRGGQGQGHWVAVRMSYDPFRPTWYRDAEENAVHLSGESCENGYAANDGTIDSNTILRNFCCINYTTELSKCVAPSKSGSTKDVMTTCTNTQNFQM